MYIYIYGERHRARCRSLPVRNPTRAHTHSRARTEAPLPRPPPPPIRRRPRLSVAGVSWRALSDETASRVSALCGRPCGPHTRLPRAPARASSGRRTCAPRAQTSESGGPQGRHTLTRTSAARRPAASLHTHTRTHARTRTRTHARTHARTFSSARHTSPRSASSCLHARTGDGRDSDKRLGRERRLTSQRLQLPARTPTHIRDG